jgi:hypothetical protein
MTTATQLGKVIMNPKLGWHTGGTRTQKEIRKKARLAQLVARQGPSENYCAGRRGNVVLPPSVPSSTSLLRQLHRRLTRS